MTDDWRGDISRIIELSVTPGASRDKIVAEKNEKGEVKLRVYVTTQPEAGKANEAVIRLLSKELGIAKSSVEIVSGMTSRQKRVRITR